MPSNPYAIVAQGVVYTWEKNYKKDLPLSDRQGLITMITAALQEAAWRAQQPHVPQVMHPKS